MKTIALRCALLLLCLTAAAGCASRHPMYGNCCPPAATYCPPACPAPCPMPCPPPGYGGGQMPYAAGYGGGMPYGQVDGGFMPDGPSGGGMTSYPASYGAPGCPNCN